jgi:hypothetical protein
MGCLISSYNFNKAVALATALTTVACLVPESVQAGILRFSGSPNIGETSLNFNLDDSVQDSKKLDPNIGFFKGAVQQAIYTCETKNSNFGCNKKGNKFLFKSGDLTASKISENTVQYEAMLSDGKSNVLNLAILVGSNDSAFINSLSALSQFLIENKKVNVVANLNSSSPLIGDPGNPFHITEVPDPNMTSSLLGIGAIGTLLLLKRIRR